MRVHFRASQLFAMIMINMLASNLHAGVPLLTFTPLTATTLSVPSGNTASVQYQVTNQSKKTYTLYMKPIAGISQTASAGYCSNPFTLGSQQSCILNIAIHGSALNGSVNGGPQVCRESNYTYCYEPAPANVLNIDQLAYTVGGLVQGLTGTLQLQNNNESFQINTNGVFSFPTPVANNGSYAISVQTQPIGQACRIQNGSGTVAGANVSNVVVTCQNATAVLTPSITTLALSINSVMTNPALTGNPRIITITNNGGSAATDLLIDYPVLPTSTTISSTCGTQLNAGASCTMTLTPGSVASSSCTVSYTAPSAAPITISAANAVPTTTNVYILGYGCIYEQGYIYAIDDTTPSSTSIGGAVTALSNQRPAYPNGLAWSANSSGVYDGGVAIYAISSDSDIGNPLPNTINVAGQSVCVGKSDGMCDSNNIILYYDSLMPTIHLSYYPAGICRDYDAGDGVKNWYLPAICEMGPKSDGSNCAPNTQNMVENLPNLIAGLPSSTSLVGGFWSSTQGPLTPQIAAWGEVFDVNGGSFAWGGGKPLTLGVRCSRPIT